MRDFFRGLVITWATRTRFWGVKDPRRATPEQIQEMASHVRGLIQ
jgi:hypothetical protein